MATSPMPDPNMLLQLAQQRQRETNPALMTPSPNPVLNQARQQVQQQQQPTTQIQHPEAGGTQPPPLSPAQQRLNTLTAHKPALENVYGDITQSKLGRAHPILGKLLGGLAQIPATAADIGLSAVAPKIGGLIPGTSAQHAEKIQNNMGLIKEEGAQREQQSRIGEQQARTGLLNEQAAAAHLTPATAEEAKLLNIPEGTPLTPALKEKLEQNQQTVGGRHDVAEISAQAKIEAADIAAAAKRDTAQLKPGTPEEQFIEEFRKVHPGASISDAIHSYDLIPKFQPPPQQLIFTPNQAGGETASVAKPGSQIAPGAQTAAGVNAVNTPTVQQRTAAGRAQTVIDQAPEILAEIDRLSPSLGPIAGRWNEFMQGKVGMDNPDFAGLRTDLVMMSSAVALAHALGRLPENLRQEFDHMINAPQQTPENIKAVINHVLPWLQRMEQQGKGPQAPAEKSFSLKQAMSLPFNKGKTEQQVREDLTKHGYKVGP